MEAVMRSRRGEPRVVSIRRNSLSFSFTKVLKGSVKGDNKWVGIEYKGWVNVGIANKPRLIRAVSKVENDQDQVSFVSPNPRLVSIPQSDPPPLTHLLAAAAKYKRPTTLSCILTCIHSRRSPFITNDSLSLTSLIHAFIAGRYTLLLDVPMASTSVALAVSHAVTFLTAKLAGSYAPSALVKLQTVLEANLIAHYSSSWVPTEPVRGSGRRCMTLSPTCLPPRPVWTACAAANVQWFDWIALLGNSEFDLFVDPACVAIRCQDKIVNVWSAESAKPAAPVKVAVSTHRSQLTVGATRKTFAQKVLEEDKEEEEKIFTMLADEISAPTWMTPILTQFPAPTRSTSPLSSISEQSRCSSRSSNSSSSGFSFTSADTASSRTSAASAKSASSDLKPSRRERARQARVFVDTTRTEVTPYDGGKTTVLTGGVMLGGGPKAAAKPKFLAANNAAMTHSNSWRSVRA
ncbi:hypothetical protein GALMADRAFT_291127 [Galerina marginata CBS 339.88]|uniref:Anti-proliferative protein domain-containing protein n=1 Tax=Galerina marginata (strain CBS 339.88) TaxID=685588 RepID=A0A067TXS7_GALM3|nr:hypothetical protein GALMADRAFT_291127 [Galerina marginata CBS 339.88]